MAACVREKFMELRDRLRSGSSALRDLDNGQRGGSSKHKGRRRRSKTQNEKEAAVVDVKSSQTVVKPRGESMVTNDTDARDSKMIIRGIIDDIVDDAYNQCECGVIEYSFTKEEANEWTTVFLENDLAEEIARTVQREITEQRERTLELLNKAEPENVEDVMLRATMHSNQSIHSVSGTGQSLGEMMAQLQDEDSYLPRRGWKWILCGSCVTNPYQQKKEKVGFLTRLRRLFRRQ